jgi:hypothetical protein
MPDPQAHRVRPVKVNAICSILFVPDILRLLSQKFYKTSVLAYHDKNELVKLPHEYSHPPVKDAGPPDKSNNRAN